MKTSELINIILNNLGKFVEARLMLKGGYATHFFIMMEKSSSMKV